jgi:hypothetical protein
MYKIKIVKNNTFYPYRISIYNDKHMVSENNFTLEETNMMREVAKNNKSLALLNVQNRLSVIHLLCVLILKGEKIEVEEI